MSLAGMSSDMTAIKKGPAMRGLRLLTKSSPYGGDFVFLGR